MTTRYQPEGYTTVSPYLIVHGAAATIDFLQRVFDATELRRYPNAEGRVMHAEVRIGDFVDNRDINIYRQLAGGVTSSNILHGSANPIGGQNQVLKFRWGALPEEMKFEGAPPGIKFALGENVKQSNWGDRFTTRYPQTRMGVEQIMRDAFQRAKAYRARWAAWQRDMWAVLVGVK